jgi:uncharacterized membrane protein YukC
MENDEEYKNGGEELQKSIDEIKKVKKRDMTSLGIIVYLCVLAILYILYGFVFTSCVYDKFVILKNLILDIPNVFTIPPTPEPVCIPR